MATTAPQATKAAKAISPWEGFHTGLWQNDINVRDFIQQNYTPYDGDAGFLAPATARTQAIWNRLTELFVEERRKGVLDVSQIPSSITAHSPGSTRSSSGCRPMRRSSGRSCRTAVSAWWPAR
jgi:formate C-acetyltransferase